MASGRNRLAALIGDDTFQFTFSVPVPKSNPPTYQRSEKPEPSSDNSTPDSSSSQLLFSLIPESHDGDGSDESEVGDEEKRQVEDYSAHHELHAKASPEESTTPADHQPKARSEQVVVRRLRTRSVIVSDNSASNGAQKSSRKNSTAKRNPLQRKRKADPNDENHHHSIAPTTDEDSIPAASTKDHDKIPPTKVRRSWKSRHATESERLGLKETKERYFFTKSTFAASSEIKQDQHDYDEHSYSTENSLLETSHHEHSRLEISQLEDSGVENSLEISQLEEPNLQNSHLADSHFEFRSGYDYFVGVSEEENDDYGYHASDEHEGSGDGVGHILDASDALKMIKQRRQERLSKKTHPPQADSCESLPPSNLPPAKSEKMVPTSKSEDFCYVDSDCEEPPPPPPDARDNEDGRKLVYVFRGQRYFTDVDLTEIPWAAADSDDEDDLQQIRFKPRVLWPDHPEDVNSRIKLRDTPANSRLL